MTKADPQQLQLWGRANSVNVQKVLWCLAELGLSYERIDAGMQFGRNTEPAYLAMNPNGRVPTLVDGGFVLWESNSVMRYLAIAYGAESGLYPAEAKPRAGIDRWLDWTLSTLQPAERDVFWGLVRTPPAERDMSALQQKTDGVAKLWRILDAHFATRLYAEAESFSLADIALGTYARRWFGVEGVVKPALPALECWFRRVSERPGFQRFVAPPLT